MEIKSIKVYKPGNYSALQIETERKDLPIPTQHIRIQVAYCGVNYADCLVRWGIYESAKKYVGFPITPGFEVAGTVIGVSDISNKSALQIGDQVLAFCFFGGYTSVIDIPASQVFKIPKNQNLNEMAGFPAAFFTAYHALNQLVRFYPQSKLLVHSAAGGVGSALCQLALTEGHTVVGVVGSTAKVQYLKNLGVQHVIDKSSCDWQSEAKKIGSGSYDGIFDANGADSYLQSYKLLAPTGKLICYGSHAILPQSSRGNFNYLKAAYGLLKSPKFDPLKMITDNKSVVGFNISFLFAKHNMINEAMDQLFKYLEQGKIRPLAVQEFSFADAGKAHQLIESGKSVGKIILRV